MKTLLTTLLFLTAITAQAQLPIPGTTDSIERWKLMIWEATLPVILTEVVDGDTVSIEWVQPLYRSNYNYVENVPPDSQKVDSLIVYTYDVGLSLAGDSAIVQDAYEISLLPGDYVFSVKALTLAGGSTPYGEPFAFRVVSQWPLMYPVRIRLIVRLK